MIFILFSEVYRLIKESADLTVGCFIPNPLLFLVDRDHQAFQYLHLARPMCKWARISQILQSFLPVLFTLRLIRQIKATTIGWIFGGISACH